MTQAPAINHPAYYADYLALREQTAGPDWLNARRAAAWQRFDAAGFPTARRGNEPWKYTSVAPIARAQFVNPLVEPGYSHPGEPQSGDFDLPAALPTAGYNLVFVDGRYLPYPGGKAEPAQAAAAAVTVGSLADALVAEPETVRRYLGDLAAVDEPFVALNTAFLREGAYIRLPDDCADEVIINITYCATGAAAGHSNGNPAAAIVTYPRTLIIAGRNANLTVLESYTGPGGRAGGNGATGRYFTNAVTEIALSAGAQVNHYRLLDESRDAYHIGTTRVTQAGDSSYTSGSFARGMALGRHDLSVLLNGPGAYCSLNGLYLAEDAQHIDNLVSIDHARPHGTSRLYYKGILDGRSKAVFGGTVLVREQAQKTDAQQTDKNLLLSDRAEVDSKPSLLIYADDVKCGHGATAGHIDADVLFYMQSRGLDPQTASRILIHAFAREVIDSVENAEIRDYLDGIFRDAVADKTLPAAAATAGGAGTVNSGSGRTQEGA